METYRSSRRDRYAAANSIIAPDDAGEAALQEMVTARVGKVFDGDGFLGDVWHPERVKWIEQISFRLAFVDAPEIKQPSGNRAREFLQNMISGKKLRLEIIAKESTPDSPLDPYRRVLCMAYLTEEMAVGKTEYFYRGNCGVGTIRKARAVTRNVELELVVNGWAWVTEQYAFDREEEYFAAQSYAKEQRRGLWAMNNPEPPWKFKHRKRARRKAAERQPHLF